MQSMKPIAGQVEVVRHGCRMKLTEHTQNSRKLVWTDALRIVIVPQALEGATAKAPDHPTKFSQSVRNVK
jgi:hypothetical protein